VGPEEGALLKLVSLLEGDQVGRGRVKGDDVGPELVGAAETLVGDADGELGRPVNAFFNV
jgi:hypothetical protein